MDSQIIITELRGLKLAGMAAEFERQCSDPSVGSLPIEQRIGMMVTHEMAARRGKRILGLLKNAHLKQPQAALSSIDYTGNRGLDRATIASLGSCEYIRQGLGILIVGATGTGKTFLSCAFGSEACTRTFTVQYWRTPLLLETLKGSHISGAFSKLIFSLGKLDLLILDDFGMCQYTDEQQHDLLEVIDQRAGKSIIVASQVPAVKWLDCFFNKTIGDAILDRLIHQAYQVTLTGPSVRGRK
jgi:DNA replication protein DnaC